MKFMKFCDPNLPEPSTAVRLKTHTNAVSTHTHRFVTTVYIVTYCLFRRSFWSLFTLFSLNYTVHERKSRKKARTMAYKRLSRGLEMLDNKIKEFPIGAITIDDFMPVEDKIKDLRSILKEMDARILSLRAMLENSKGPQLPEEDEDDITETLKKLRETTSNQITNEKAVTMCLEADVIEEMISFSNQQSPEDQEKLTLMPRQLYLLNHEGLSLHNTIKELMQKQLLLKIEAQNVAQEYQEFLQQQEELRLQRLQKSNPEMAEYKQKMEKSIRKINIMKRLIVNFIASSGTLMREEPILLEMLEKHRDIVSFETISNMTENDDSSQS